MKGAEEEEGIEVLTSCSGHSQRSVGSTCSSTLSIPSLATYRASRKLSSRPQKTPTIAKHTNKSST